MAPAGLHEFLALTEGRTDTEIAHVLAVLTAATQHMDQTKEHADMSGHKRQAPNATFDELRGRYYGSDKEKRRALVDEIAADPQVQRGVTVTQPVAFEQPGRIVGRRRARLMFGGDE